MLSQPDILREIETNRLRFDPAIDPASVEQVSIDLKLGRSFSKFKRPPDYLVTARIDPSIWNSADLWEHSDADYHDLEGNGGFVLAQTLETVCLPNDLAGLIEGRSSFARVGISVHVTAPKIDPGFNGTIVLEMTNHGPLTFRLFAGDKPAQLILFRISTALPAAQLYGARAAHLFQYQKTPTPRTK